MKNLEKGAVTNSRLPLHPSRVFARFLQHKFLRRRNATKAGQASSSPNRNVTKVRLPDPPGMLDGTLPPPERAGFTPSPSPALRERAGVRVAAHTNAAP